MDQVVSVFDQQFRTFAAPHCRELVGWQRRGELPSFATHGIVAKAAGELALRAIDLAMQVVALEVADQLGVEVKLVQVAAALVPVVQVLAGRKGQRGQIAKRIEPVGQGAWRRGSLDKPAQQVVGKIQPFFMHTELLALAGRQAVNAAQTIGIVVFIILTSIAIGLGQQTAIGSRSNSVVRCGRSPLSP